MTTTSLDAERRSRRSYLSPDVCNAAQITYRQLDYWTRTGLVTASGHAATGSGDARWYHDSDVMRAAVISALINAGIALPALRRNIDNILATGAHTTDNVTIAVDLAAIGERIGQYRRVAS